MSLDHGMPTCLIFRYLSTIYRAAATRSFSSGTGSMVPSFLAPNEVSVADLEASKEIYKATERRAKSDYFDHFKSYGIRSVFATKPYEDHHEKRKYISAFYHPSTIYRLQKIEQQVKKCSHAFINTIQINHEIDVYAMSSLYAFDIMTFLAF